MDDKDFTVKFREYAEALHQDKLGQLKRDVINNYASIRLQFIESFVKLCEKIHCMQAKKEKREIAYINYSLLRTQIIKNNPVYLINAYDDTWYVDNSVCEELYNVSWALKYLDEFESELNIERKKYIGRITSRDVQRIKLDKAGIYNEFILQLARKSIREAIKTTEFKKVATSEKLDVRVGEYFDFSESVYINDNTPKDSLKTKILLEKKYPYAYGYQNYKSLDLKDGDYGKNNFTYTVFEECDLSQCKFENALLRGTKFEHCKLNNASFRNTVIIGTDFSNSQLSGADFGQSNSNVYFTAEDFENPLYERINFQHANLKNANLSNTNMGGADFTGAVLEGCTFRNTNLEKAIVSKKYRDNDALFSPLQKEQICWTD